MPFYSLLSQVLRRHSEYPGADSLSLKAIKSGQEEAEALAGTIRQLHPQAQLVDILPHSTSTAVKHFLGYHPKQQAKAEVTGSSSAPGQALSSSDHQKVQRRTKDLLVEAAKEMLGTSPTCRCVGEVVPQCPTPCPFARACRPGPRS